jgi:nitrite reductase/ring-hydroxylating ferredoxin subunit
MRKFEVPGAEPIAVYNVDGIVYATAEICTHAKQSLTEGELEGHEVMCPAHWATFDVRTGAALCFPASEPLTVYPVTVVDGMITVAIESVVAHSQCVDSNGDCQ